MAEGDQTVPIINRLIGAYDAVIYTQDWHPPSTPHFEKDGGIWPVHCVGGTWGAAFHDRVLIAGPEIKVIEKIGKDVERVLRDVPGTASACPANPASRR